MRAVWKYPFVVQHAFTLSMPRQAEILSVQVQREQPVLWALVNPTAPAVLRAFVVLATGETCQDDDLMYRGTFQLAGGTLVFHLFEKWRTDVL